MPHAASIHNAIGGLTALYTEVVGELLDELKQREQHLKAVMEQLTTVRTERDALQRERDELRSAGDVLQKANEELCDELHAAQNVVAALKNRVEELERLIPSEAKNN